jgi:uncharacterized membrane protein
VHAPRNRGGAHRNRRLWSRESRIPLVSCLAVTGVLTLLDLAGLDSPFRPILAVAFFLAVPGWAVVAWLDLAEALLAWTLAVGLSLAAGITIAEMMLWTHQWSPFRSFMVLAAASGLSLTARLWRDLTEAVNG